MQHWHDRVHFTEWTAVRSFARCNWDVDCSTPYATGGAGDEWAESGRRVGGDSIKRHERQSTSDQPQQYIVSNLLNSFYNTAALGLGLYTRSSIVFVLAFARMSSVRMMPSEKLRLRFRCGKLFRCLRYTPIEIPKLTKFACVCIVNTFPYLFSHRYTLCN